MSKELDDFLNSHKDRVDALERTIDAQNKHIDALTKINEIERERHGITKQVLNRVVTEYFDYKDAITKYILMLRDGGADISPLDDTFFANQEKREAEIRELISAVTE